MRSDWHPLDLATVAAQAVSVSAPPRSASNVSRCAPLLPRVHTAIAVLLPLIWSIALSMVTSSALWRASQWPLFLSGSSSNSSTCRVLRSCARGRRTRTPRSPSQKARLPPHSPQAQLQEGGSTPFVAAHRSRNAHRHLPTSHKNADSNCNRTHITEHNPARDTRSDVAMWCTSHLSATSIVKQAHLCFGKRFEKLVDEDGTLRWLANHIATSLRVCLKLVCALRFVFDCRLNLRFCDQLQISMGIPRAIRGYERR